MPRIGANEEDLKITLDSEQIDIQPKARWSTQSTADNTAITLTKSAEAGKSHYIESVSGSFSAAAIKKMTLKDGATVIGTFYVHDSFAAYLGGVKITANTDAVLTLEASGTAGTIGALTLPGWTE